MVKRRRRKYPSRSMYGSGLSVKAVKWVIATALVVIIAYYGYAYVTEWLSGVSLSEEELAIDDESIVEREKEPSEQQAEETQPSLRPDIPANKIQVEVLNGCGVRRLAALVTDSLRAHGFDVVKTGNFDSRDLEKTMVILRSAKEGRAKMVADYLGTDNIMQQTMLDLMLDVTVVLGKDYSKLKFFLKK